MFLIYPQCLLSYIIYLVAQSSDPHRIKYALNIEIRGTSDLELTKKIKKVANRGFSYNNLSAIDHDPKNIGPNNKDEVLKLKPKISLELGYVRTARTFQKIRTWIM